MDFSSCMFGLQYNPTLENHACSLSMAFLTVFSTTKYDNYLVGHPKRIDDDFLKIYEIEQECSRSTNYLTRFKIRMVFQECEITVDTVFYHRDNKSDQDVIDMMPTKNVYLYKNSFLLGEVVDYKSSSLDDVYNTLILANLLGKFEFFGT